jgi:GT2 family glycosyltransferase
MAPSTEVGVAVISRDRRDTLLSTLERLRALPQRPPIVVVDDGSRDGTADAVRRRFPDVRVHRLGDPAGAAARTLAVRLLDTPIVAFADDDSWWAPDALDLIADAFAASPRLGLVAARVLVGAEQRLDPTCEAMRTSPLTDGEPPGPRVLGFVACGSAVRREAFLAVGGYRHGLGVGGEESLLSIDLAAAGWELRYLDAAVAHHHPDAGAPRPGREVTQRRNALWVLWLRRPARIALAGTARALQRGPAGRRALLAALRGAPRVLADRRRVPEPVERDLRRLEAAGG